MKSVLMSIQPKWCELIASGKKTVEVRKSKPKLQPPFKVYIYCTANKKGVKDLLEIHGKDGIIRKANGKVIGEFVCDRIIDISYMDLFENFRRLIHDIITPSCLKVEEIESYLGYKDGYGWHITNLVIYDVPRELSEFRQVKKIRGYHRAGETMAERLLNGTRVEVSYFTRPPQSWCYVESEVAK